MEGWLYLIKNGDLYKIGITRNLDNRMRQLKPDNIVAKLYSRAYKSLEKEFHKKYKDVRIPQTEYFRLNNKQVNDIKRRIGKFYFPKSFTFDIIRNSFLLLMMFFVIIILLINSFVNDFVNVAKISFQWMTKISFCYSFLSLTIRSDKYLSFFNEIKFRGFRFFVLITFCLFFKVAYKYLV